MQLLLLTNSLILHTLLPSIFALPPDPAIVLPATPRYHLECKPYPPSTSPSSPLPCGSLIKTSLEALSPATQTFFFSNNPSKADPRYGPVPFSLSSQDYATRTALEIANTTTTGGLAAAADGMCTLTFAFQPNTPADHSELWATRLLTSIALQSWASCMVDRDMRPKEPPMWASIVLKPRSEARRLVMEVKAEGGTGVAVG